MPPTASFQVTSVLRETAPPIGGQAVASGVDE